MSRRPPCRFSDCSDAAIFALAPAPWRTYCYSHAERVCKRFGGGLRMRPLEPSPPLCEHPDCGWPAALLITWGPRAGRRKFPPEPTLRCVRHGRELLEALALDAQRYVQRLPLGWKPPPDRSTLPTWREQRALARDRSA